MVDLAPGVTRHPLGRRRLVKVDRAGLVVAAVLFVAGNAAALALGGRSGTEGGRVRPDLLVRDGDGNLKFIESKNGPSAGLTKNQNTGYPAMRSGGGIPRGGNAADAGLPPGEPIGPTPV